MNFTVFGSNGFIGSHLARSLILNGQKVYLPDRNALPKIRSGKGPDLGHVIYCIGLTSDFRLRPFEVLEAHIHLVADLLQYAMYNSFLYISSTRVYSGVSDSSETTALSVHPGNHSDLYNLSKLTGESICLQIPRNTVRVVRLSNVYGIGDSSQNFLSSVLKEAASQGNVTIYQASSSRKDYISVNEVVRLLPEIALKGRERIYNLAQGTNVSHAEIALALRKQGCEVFFAHDSPQSSFPEINILRLIGEFCPPDSDVVEDIPDLLRAIEVKNHSISD